MTGHGFRSLASICLNEQGYHPDLIELQLAHAERNQVRSAYNKAQRLPERRRMMQAWADYLDGLRASGNVVPIRRATGRVAHASEKEYKALLPIPAVPLDGLPAKQRRDRQVHSIHARRRRHACGSHCAAHGRRWHRGYRYPVEEDRAVARDFEPGPICTYPFPARHPCSVLAVFGSGLTVQPKRKARPRRGVLRTEPV